MRIFLAAVLALWLVPPAVAQPRAQTNELAVVAADAPRLALVLSNGKYATSPLANPPNDAAAMSRVLRKLNFEVVEGRDLGRLGMWRAVEQFSQRIKALGPETVGLVFYAGHGLEIDGENFILPVDAEIRSKAEVKLQALSVKTIADQLGKAGNQINILVLDACRNNPFRGLSFRASDVRGLTAMGAVYGVFIASSTAAGDVALDGVGEKNSPYTRALSEAMMAPGHALDDVFSSVRRRVMTATGQQQVPWESSSLVVKFYFIPPPEQVSAAQQLFEAGRQTRNIELLQLVIQKYHGSPAAIEAEKHLKDLRREAAAAAEAETRKAKELATAKAKADQLKTRDADAAKISASEAQKAREAEAQARAKEAEALKAREVEAQRAQAQKARDDERRTDEMARTVMERAEQIRNAETFDLVVSLFPQTKYAPEAKARAAALRAEAATARAQPLLEGADLIRAIQTELARKGCLNEPATGRFDPATVQGLRAFAGQSDARFYWHRPTMAALRVLKSENAQVGCGVAESRPMCIQVNGEAICE